MSSTMTRRNALTVLAAALPMTVTKPTLPLDPLQRHTSRRSSPYFVAVLAETSALCDALDDFADDGDEEVHFDARALWLATYWTYSSLDSDHMGDASAAEERAAARYADEPDPLTRAGLHGYDTLDALFEFVTWHPCDEDGSVCHLCDDGDRMAWSVNGFLDLLLSETVRTSDAGRRLRARHDLTRRRMAARLRRVEATSREMTACAARLHEAGR